MNTFALPDTKPTATWNLPKSWCRAWKGVGAMTDGSQTYHALIALYGQPHRRYHTLQHLQECLNLLEHTQHLSQNPAAIEVALWFHDAIYNVKRSDNEEQSAQWAKATLREAGVADDVAEHIHSLVMVTRHTGTPCTGDEQLLVDIDLSILASPPARFSEYEQQIQDEYAYVPRWLFKRKRRAILQSLLDRPRLYGTPYFHDAMELTARENLCRAIGIPAS